MVSDDNHPFVLILVNLSFFSFIAKSVELNGLPLHLLVPGDDKGKRGTVAGTTTHDRKMHIDVLSPQT